MTDRLTLTRAFEGAGLKSGDAERIATEIYDAIHDNVATKADIADAPADIAEMRADMREMELRLEKHIDRMVIRLDGALVVVASLLFTALHYWPPHG